MASGLAIGLGIAIPIAFWSIVIFLFKEKLFREWQNREPTQPTIYQPGWEMTILSNARTNKVYSEEFRIISQSSIGYPCSTASHPQNLSKNRYRDAIPYDANRIVLKNSKNGDYINASNIAGLFIATQDPMPDQDEDFWLMVWQNEVSVIIRLSSDSIQFPMAKYLPDIVNDTWVFGLEEIKISPIAFHHLGDIKIANLKLEKDNLLRRIVVLHLTSWREGSTPSVNDALQLVASAQIARDRLKGMVLVHCGAGSGRTGTIIALWKIKEAIMRGQEPNVYTIVSNLRHERPGMVQTPDQYAFLYKCKRKYTANPYLFLGTDVLTP